MPRAGGSFFVVVVALLTGCENTIVVAPVCERAVDCPEGEACVSGRCELLPEGAGGDRAEPLPTGEGEGEGEGEPAPTCDPAACDDGVYCNGLEGCDDETDACADGAPPCTAALCDEGRDLCADPPEGDAGSPPDEGGDADAGFDDAGFPTDAGFVDEGDAGCAPQCAGRDCGDDGCGGDCGACGDFQTCDAAGQCVFVGDVCDAMTDVLTIGAFQTRTGTLSATTDSIYGWDRPYERILDSYILDVIAPTATTTTFTATSTDFDMVLYAYDDTGTCSEVAKNDDIDGAANRDSRFTLPASTPATQIVVTSFEASKPGAYTLTTTSKLCGLDVTAAVYAACAPKVASPNAPADECAWNPCLNYGASPEFCCIKEACRTGFGNGTAIVIEEDPVGCDAQ